MTRLEEYEEMIKRCKTDVDQTMGDHPLKPIVLKAIIDYAEQCYHAEALAGFPGEKK